MNIAISFENNHTLIKKKHYMLNKVNSYMG